MNEEFDPSAAGAMPFRRVSANLDLIVAGGTCNFCPWRECDTSLGVKKEIRSGWTRSAQVSWWLYSEGMNGGIFEFIIAKLASWELAGPN